MSMRAIMAVRDYSQSSGADYALMLVIADGVDSSVGLMRGRDMYKLARLAHLCGYDATETQQHNARRRCQRMITALMKRGELIVVTGGYRAKNQYLIPILLGEPGYNPQPCDDTTHDCNRYHTPLDVSREDEAIAEADRRMRAENNGRQFTPANLRRAAPEPPQTRPIDRPKQKKARDAAPEPPQMRPIDRPRAAPEPPQTRPIDRTVSHSNPIVNPNVIPGAAPHTEKKSDVATEADALTPPPPPPPQALQAWAYVCKRLRAGGVTDAQMATWVLPLRLDNLYWLASGELVAEITARSSSQIDMLDRRYGYQIRAAFGALYGIAAALVILDMAAPAMVSAAAQ